MIQRVFRALLAFAAVTLPASVAFAQDGKSGFEFLGMAIALGIGLAALGGTFGQGKLAAAAVEGISRNPNAADKVFVPMILGLAFIESLVLFTWVLMLLMQLSM